MGTDRGKIERKGGKIVKYGSFSCFYPIFPLSLFIRFRFVVYDELGKSGRIFLYPLVSLGSTPNCSLKHLVKYFGSLKPTAYATSDMETFGDSCSIFLAVFNR